MIHVFTSLFGHTTKYITSKKHTTKRHSLINVLRRDTLKFSHCVYLHDAALRSTVVRSVLTLCIAGETDVAHTRPHLPHLYDVFFAALAACRRERTSSHVSHSGSACVAHGAGKSARIKCGHGQNWVGVGDPMGWKEATVPALCPG